MEQKQQTQNDIKEYRRIKDSDLQLGSSFGAEKQDLQQVRESLKKLEGKNEALEEQNRQLSLRVENLIQKDNHVQE